MKGFIPQSTCEQNVIAQPVLRNGRGGASSRKRSFRKIFYRFESMRWVHMPSRLNGATAIAPGSILLTFCARFARAAAVFQKEFLQHESRYPMAEGGSACLDL